MNNTIADGWYKWMFSGKVPGFTKVVNGRVSYGHGPKVTFCLEHGDTFEPAVIMTQAEYNATIARQQEYIETPERSNTRLQAKSDHFQEIAHEFEAITRQAIAERDSLRAQLEEQGQDCREALAAYAHEAWSGWMRYLFSKGEFVETGVQADGLTERVYIMPAWAVDRWQRQMVTPYGLLSDAEKESDRAEADKMLAILQRRTVGEGE